MYYTSLGGVVAAAALDGSGAKNLITGQGTWTGSQSSICRSTPRSSDQGRARLALAPADLQSIDL